MDKAPWRRSLIILMVLATLNLSACGTLLYPERKGNVSGRIDPAIAILDGLGLLVYFVPGVIAFAVDFTNGTIYLPDGTAKKLSDKEPLLIDLPEISFPEINLPSIEFTDKQSRTNAKPHDVDLLKLEVLKPELLNAVAKYYDLPPSAFQVQAIDTIADLDWADRIEAMRVLAGAPRKT